MADRNLKSITFPDLPSRYVIPQVEVDSSLTQQGKAADAKVTGDALKAGIAPAYDASSTYAVGEYVMYNNALYRCTTAITTAEAWTAAHWTAAKIGEDLTDCSRQISDNLNILEDKEAVGVSATASGGYLSGGDGTWKNSSSFQVKKYAVTEGDYLFLDIAFPYASSGTVFQFQNNATIPGASPNQYIIGDRYTQAFNGNVIVPEGATFLMVVSKANEEDTNIIQKVTPKNADLVGRVEYLEEKQTFKSTDFGADWIASPSTGYTYKKTGAKIVIDGVRTGSTSVGTSLTTDTISSINNKFTDPTFVNPKLALKAGRTYLVRIKFLDGQLIAGSQYTVIRRHSLILDMYNGTDASYIELKYFEMLPSETVDISALEPYEMVLTPAEDLQCGFMWYCKGYLTIENFAMQFDIEDITNYKLFAEVNAHDIVTENEEAITRIQASNWWWGAKAERPSMLNLLHFSDIHGWKAELERVVKMKRYLEENGMLTDAICTGDLVTASYGGGDYENIWLKTAGTSDILFAIGNHDTYRQGGSPHGTLTAAEKYAAYFDGHTSGWEITMESDTSYYYKDYAESGIRLIVVDTSVGDSDPDQKTWLETVLADAKTLNYAVIVAAHYLRLNSSTDIKSATIYDNCWSNTRARAAGTDTMTYDWTGTDIVKCVTDFISNGGTFICYLIGHTHSDIIGYPTGHPDQLIITVCAAAVGEAIAANRVNTCGDLPRKTGSKTEDCFNLITVNPTNKVLHCIRIGSDINMLQIPRKAFCWDYDNHAFISVM